MIKYTVGADPELFLKDSSDKLISAIGRIGGTKDDPSPIGNGCFLQEDNVSVEFNIPPCQSLEEFKKHIQYNLDTIVEKVKAEGLFLNIVASGSFSPDQLADERALVFGCDPDFNAWTKKMNRPPRSKDASLRSAGGHIHVGYRDADPFHIARCMDLYLGVPSVLKDEDTRRRELYGSAGACRRKPYGVEYRTLSNFWIRDEAGIAWAWDQTAKAMEAVEREFDPANDEEIADMIQTCINTSDKALAEVLIRELKVA